MTAKVRGGPETVATYRGLHDFRCRDVTAVALLVVGYPVALGMLARLRSTLQERRVWSFTALEAAMASIVAGWSLYGRPLAALVNGAALAGFAIAWSISGRRARP